MSGGRLSRRGREPRSIAAPISPIMPDGAYVLSLTMRGHDRGVHHAQVLETAHAKPRIFRRTAVRSLERSGVSRSVATKITGHRIETVYRRYAIVNDQDLHEAAAKLAGAHF